MHPNHHQYNYYNNHKTTTTTTSTSSSIPVHNANNRLPNNTVFHNNQYTFSLSRNADGGGYLDPRPLSAASLYGDGPRISRGTKSDIGVPCRRQSSTSKALLHNHNASTGVHKTKLPSVKSDFLLSYLNNNSKANNDDVVGLGSGCHVGYGGRTQQANSITSPYYISGGCTTDYLEPYRPDPKRLYSSSSKLEHIDLHANRTDRQRNGVHNFGRQSNATNTTANSTANNANSNLGPLLYLDSFERFNDKSTYSNAQYQSMQSVSKTYNAWIEWIYTNTRINVYYVARYE